MSYLLAKRIFDCILSSVGLFLFFPVISIVAVLIFLEDGLPILYIKKSLGMDGKLFNMLKFRSMKGGTLSVTKVGRILRATALDELPQLTNIIKGEMSFVGPRPYSIDYYGISKDFQGKIFQSSLGRKDMEIFARRLKIKPGLTGLAQVFAPKHACDEEVLRWDVQYIKERSFLLDLKIIFLSIWISFVGRWEHRNNKL
ncbi:MAG: sugar transferase [Candidatus Omnitrophota bacterium]